MKNGVRAWLGFVGLGVLCLSVPLSSAGSRGALDGQEGQAASAGDIPALSELLESAGWQSTPELSGVFKAGHISEVSSTGHRPLATDCIDRRPDENVYTATEVITSLQSGVTVRGLVARARVSGEIVRKVKFGTPSQHSIPRVDLVLTEGCIAKLQAQPAAVIDSAYVIQEVLRAQIDEQTCGRVDGEGRIVGLGAADVELSRACSQVSLEPVAVGYRTVPLRTLLGASFEVAPPVVAVVDINDEDVDFADLVAQAKQAERAREAAEERERLAKEAYEQELQVTVAEAAAEHTRRATRDFESIRDLVYSSTAPEAEQILEKYLEKYGKVEVTVAGRTVAVTVPEVREVERGLQRIRAADRLEASVLDIPTGMSVWFGQYRCVHGLVKLRADVRRSAGTDKITATMSFSPHPDNPDSERRNSPASASGKFLATAEVGKDGHVRLKPVSWIDQPGPSWEASVLSGRVEGKQWTGKVEFAGCSSFSLTRTY